MIVADLDAIARGAAGAGVLWSLAGSRDLDVNLVRLRAGERIAEHVNGELEVLLVGVSGVGRVLVDGTECELSPSRLILVARGASRAIRAGAEPLAYLSLHRRRARGLLQVRPPR